jgi:hypothetical protein
MGWVEAGILPTELLPLSRHLKYRTNSNLWAMAKSASLRIQILPPDVPLFILKDEAQRIRAAWSKKRQHHASQFPAVEIRALDRLVPNQGYPAISLNTERIFWCKTSI